MDLNELRETKAKLEHVANYCPPETASDQAWDLAEKKAIIAGNKLAQLETTFALLDAIDTLTSRVDAITNLLVKVYTNFFPDCGGDFAPDDCTEACADFFACAHHDELAAMVLLLNDPQERRDNHDGQATN